MSTRQFNILVVEDNATDVMLLREVFADARHRLTMHAVIDGVAAMAFLHRTGIYVHAPRPDLILLDLNMPRKSGLEVLEEIRDDVLLKSIPVVILTTSQANSDVAHAYACGVNCYIRKPIDFDSFADMAKSIEHFWFVVTTLPEN